jgi:hypothetical protein
LGRREQFQLHFGVKRDIVLQANCLLVQIAISPMENAANDGFNKTLLIQLSPVDYSIHGVDSKTGEIRRRIPRASS